jgi:electron transport complex protein RnfG
MAMTPLLREMSATGLALLVFSVVGAGLLSGTFNLTRPTIEISEQADKLVLVAQTLPAGSYDNDIVRDARPLPANPLLGLKRPGLAYPASQGGQVNAVVLEAVAPDGYSGEIRLLIGILADGRIAGVRVVAHKETPGLGDYIDMARSPWIKQFDGLGLSNPTPDQWKVRKDGGRFDSRAGATITPRAVVKAVRKALEYFAVHKTELLAPNPAKSIPKQEAKP